MRLLLGTHGFGHPGGSETYLLTVAEQLVRLGHEVTVAAAVTGEMSELARERGARVVRWPDDAAVEQRPDAFLVQDAVLAYDLAARFPGVPQLFRAPSEIHDFQLPPRLPEVVGAVVVVNGAMERRVQALAGERRVVRLRQPVDTERLAPRHAPRARPRRALLLGNYLDGARRDRLVEAWGREGVECARLGSPAGNADAHIEAEIAAADIVVAKSRAALDGMACGRPVYVYDVFGADGWVTADRYEALEADNFAGQAFGEAITAERLRRDLAAYDPDMGVVNRDLVLKHHCGRRHADALVELLRALEPPPAEAAPDALAELSRLTRRQWLAEADALNLRRELAATGERLAATEAALEDAREARASSEERSAAALAQAHDELAAAHDELAAARDELAAARLELYELHGDRARLWTRVHAAEAEVARLRAALDQRRVRTGMALGAAVDRVRGRSGNGTPLP